MADMVKGLRSIADAAKRPDGTDIPLGEALRNAAEEIERLRKLAGAGLKPLDWEAAYPHAPDRADSMWVHVKATGRTYSIDRESHVYRLETRILMSEYSTEEMGLWPTLEAAKQAAWLHYSALMAPLLLDAKPDHAPRLLAALEVAYSALSRPEIYTAHPVGFARNFAHDAICEAAGLNEFSPKIGADKPEVSDATFETVNALVYVEGGKILNRWVDGVDLAKYLPPEMVAALLAADKEAANGPNNT